VKRKAFCRLIPQRRRKLGNPIVRDRAENSTNYQFLGLFGSLAAVVLPPLLIHLGTCFWGCSVLVGLNYCGVGTFGVNTPYR